MKLFSYKKEAKKSDKTVSKPPKTKPVLIRFKIEDLEKIKEQAELQGLAYQTYIKSIVHKAIKKRKLKYKKQSNREIAYCAL